MTRIFSIVFISLLPSAANAGLDANEIYKFESCAPYDPNLPKEKWTVPRIALPDNTDLLIERRDFPQWGTPLGSFIKSVQNFNSGKGGAVCRPFLEDSNVPPLLTRALAEVAELTVNEIGKTIESQKKDLARSTECANRIKPAFLDYSGEFSAEHFASVPNQTLSEHQCAAVTNFVLKSLRERYQRMRFYMALTAGPEKNSSPLEHDQPLTQFIAAIRFPSVGTRVTSVPGLTPDEIPSYLAFQKSLAEKQEKRFLEGQILPRSPEQLYDSLISTTPILLQMPNGVTPRSLKTAVLNMSKQYDFDVSDFKRNPKQDIMLYTLYVESAISKIPQERREVACFAVKKVYENLIIQYEKKPQFLAMVGLAMSAPTGGTGALAAVGFKAVAGKLLGEFAKKAGIAASVFSGTTSIQNFLRYQTAIEYCGTIVREKFEDPTGDGLCTLSKTNQILEDAEVGAAAAAAIGGAMWLKGPTVTAYKKVRDAIRETGKASP